MKTLELKKMETLEGGRLSGGELCGIAIGSVIAVPSIWTVALAMTFCLYGEKKQ
jgi:hypothetical protein